MKKVYFLSLLMLGATLLIAQHQYLPTLETGKAWDREGYIQNSTYGCRTEVGCDTLIAGKKYFKILIRGILEGYAREDLMAQKVYYQKKDSLKERLVVDYSLKVGDFFNKQKVIEVKTDTFYAGKNRKMIVFGQYRNLIEGIGEDVGGITGDTPPCWLFVKESNKGVNCNTIDVFDLNKSIRIFPNPVTNSFSIQGIYEFPLLVTLYDAVGKMVKSCTIYNDADVIDINQLPKGTYLLLSVNNVGKSATQKIVKE